MIWLQSGLMNKRDNEGETWSRVTLQKNPAGYIGDILY